jgi:hypothetical protein
VKIDEVLQLSSLAIYTETIFLYADQHKICIRNVRFWHRADLLNELKVRYEREADIAFMSDSELKQSVTVL